MSNVLDGEAIERDVLSGLKGFQRATVNYVFKRMYNDPDPATRFLVADEVGLGKTLVARGLIARAINHLQAEGTKRIDVIYVCSNAEIAAQNIRRLNVTEERGYSLPTRITLLPLNLHRLAGNELNFVSFTPGTSFNLASQGGTAKERAVIFRLLEYVLGPPLDDPGAFQVLRNDMSEQNFRWAVDSTPRVISDDGRTLDIGLAKAFKADLRKNRRLITRFVKLANSSNDRSYEINRHEQRTLIGELRQTLARSCVEALEPDLIILDEFQRFRELLEEPNPNDADDIRHLAHHLFKQADARILLLSATPYKMYTLRDEEQDDHYADFLRTARFLMGDYEADLLAEDIRAFRLAIMDARTADEHDLLKRKHRIEKRLRRVMARTERLAASSDRNGMLIEREIAETRLSAADLRSYATADRISQMLGTGDVTDYCKSSPYLFNFMSDYKIKKSLRAEANNRDIVSAVEPATLLRRDQLDAYERLDPGNARLRGLASSTVDAGTWKLLWLSPSLPYYQGRGAYVDPELCTLTKRLIFSSWNVVPDAVSAILSYEAERQMMLSRDSAARNSADDRAKLRGLLAIRRQDGKPAGMSTFGLLYPCVTLAKQLDPLSIARDLGGETREVTAEEIVDEASRRVRDLLVPLSRRVPTKAPEDQRWYWAAPLLFDRRRPERAVTEAWLSASQVVRAPVATSGEDEDEAGAWSEHVAFARRVVADGIKLGRMPSDLAEAMALLGIGGPGTCALRSVARVTGRVTSSRPDFSGAAARDAAFRIAWGFRSLFNVPEVMSLLRGSADTSGEAYWRRTAEEGLNGNLQAVLDEYAHLLPEWLGLNDQDPAFVAEQVGIAIHDAVSLRSVNYRPDEVRIDADGLTFSPLPMRVRFALRFGHHTTDDQKVLHRSGAVRAAFNSPFWPFVLTSTSVGQEGLDFHLYCHAIVHWNLPANPVDLEQREGRIHRYKGHAIRKNIAERHRAAAFARRAVDPWEAMFAEAVRSAPRRGLKDIEPFWVYEGSAHIERHVPLLPLSREVEQLARLRRTLAAYRLVFGQPRQEDLVDYLRDRVTPEQLERLVQKLRIDLTPR